MTTVLASAATYALPSATAQAWKQAAAQIAPYEPADYYDDAVQQAVYEVVRGALPDAFDELVAALRRRLARAPYAALVTGVPCDDEGLCFLALSRALGRLRARPYDPPRAQLLHRVQPATDIATVRAGARHETERLHTDCADWPAPARWLAMVCHRPDPGGGGRSRLLDVDALERLLEKELDADDLAVLFEVSLPWKLADYVGGGVLRAPVLARVSNQVTVRWRRYAIDAGLAASGTTLPPAVERALDALDRALASSAAGAEFALRRGDLLVMDNHRALHARTALSEHPHSARRLMVRSWIDAHTPLAASPARAKETKAWR